jgi:hypothetical protein
LESTIGEIGRESISQELIQLALSRFTDVFETLAPYQQKELLSLVLAKAVLAPDSIKLALYGRPRTEIGLVGEQRSPILAWLPGQDSNLQPSG